MGSGSVSRDLKESWLLKSDKSRSSEGSGTTTAQEEQVDHEADSRGVGRVVEAGGRGGAAEEGESGSADGEEKSGKQDVRGQEVDLEKGLGQGQGGSEGRT